MTNTKPTELTRSGKDRVDDESVRDDRNVAWYAEADGGVYYTYEADTPVRIGEVYEVVSVILKYAPFDSFRPTEECVIEVTNHRAYPGLLGMLMAIDEESGLHEEARSC